MEKSYRKQSSQALHPHNAPYFNILTWYGIFVTMDKPGVIYYFKLKSIVYIRVHSVWYSLIGFWQMYNAIYPPL